MVFRTYDFQVNKRDIQKVNVNLINFKSTNASYSQVELTNYGKVSMPKMINNVCYYERRNDFIIHLIKQIVKDPKRKILLLADRRQQLKCV